MASSSSSSAFRNLSPAMVRELKRHVSPQPLPKSPFLHQSSSSGALTANATTNSATNQNNNTRTILAGCVLLTATAGSFPLVAHWWMGGLADKDAPLTAPQVRRGAFLNSGTKDIGRDPQWDFPTGKYKKDAGYYAIFQEEEETAAAAAMTQSGKKPRLPVEFHAMATDDLKDHEQHLRDFANGKVKQNGQPTNLQ